MRARVLMRELQPLRALLNLRLLLLPSRLNVLKLEFLYWNTSSARRNQNYQGSARLKSPLPLVVQHKLTRIVWEEVIMLISSPIHYAGIMFRVCVYYAKPTQMRHRRSRTKQLAVRPAAARQCQPRPLLGDSTAGLCQPRPPL